MISFNLAITKECPLIGFIIHFFPTIDPYVISTIMTVCKKKIIRYLNCVMTWTSTEMDENLIVTLLKVGFCLHVLTLYLTAAT